MARKKLKSNTDQRPFSMIYHDFLESGLLTTNEKMIFIALKKFADSKNQCFPSIKKLAAITGISRRKIQTTLKNMEQKRVIGIEYRSRIDGGDTSNLYTLYDFERLWNAGNNEEIGIIVNEYEEEKLISELRSRGYIITKEKVPGTTAPPKETVKPSTKNDPIILDNHTTNKTKSQGMERYTLKQIQQFFNYDTMIIDYPEHKIDIDIIFQILYDALNWSKKTIRINGQEKPSMIVISKLMKLGKTDLIYTIKKYHEQKDRIKNANAYLLTILYHAKEQSYLDLMNLGHYHNDF